MEDFMDEKKEHKKWVIQCIFLIAVLIYTAEIFFDHGGSEKYMGVLFSTDIGWNHGLYFKSFNE